MSVIKFVKHKALTEEDISPVIQMVWEDSTSFETFKERVGITKAEVIRLMRTELKPQSLSLWRKRVAGRVTKHRGLRESSIRFNDLQFADHRKPNG